MTTEDFYDECARILGCEYEGEAFPYYKRTRWNNRRPGQGRFPGHGLIRSFGDTIHVSLRVPVINAVFDSQDEVLVALRSAVALKTNPFVVGLTGGIGMGKSTVTGIAREMGIPVWDADAEVHRLYDQHDELRQWLRQRFPSCWDGDRFDRKSLRPIIFTNAETMADLTSVVGQYLDQSVRDFIHEHNRGGTPLVILDVPLLFEGSMVDWCDETITVSCSPEAQRKRVLARPGMTDALLTEFLSRQMSDAARCSRATHIVSTDCGITETTQAVRTLLSSLV